MESALERALNDSSSPVYKSNNWKSIQRYLKPKGIIIPKDDILRYLEKQKFSEVRYKNEGLQKVSQLGKQHATRAKFFSIMQADVLVLSKKKQYGTRIKYVLGAICQLSRYIFLEPCYSLKFDAQKKAWDSIISRMKSVLPHANIDTITCDSGVEFSNLSIKNYFKIHGIKLNLIALRPYRMSRGAPAIESAWRRVRKHLEAFMLEKRKGSFEETLKRVEKLCNTEYVGSMEMSPVEALRHTPMYVLLKSESLRLKKRKYLQRELENPIILEKYSVVQIKKFQEKQFISSRKESYMFLSPYFLITDVVKNTSLIRYKLSNVFTFKSLTGTFSRAELRVAPISYVDVCAKLESDVFEVVRKTDQYVYYKIKNCDRIFVANINLVS